MWGPRWRSTALPRLLNVLKEFGEGYFGVAQGTAQGVTIDLIVEWKNNSPAVPVLHFDVAAAAMNLDKSEALQGHEHLTT